jgi:hypothetical protein
MDPAVSTAASLFFIYQLSCSTIDENQKWARKTT